MDVNYKNGILGRAKTLAREFFGYSGKIIFEAYHDRWTSVDSFGLNLFAIVQSRIPTSLYCCQLVSIEILSLLMLESH